MAMGTNTRSFWDKKDYRSCASDTPGTELETITPATREFLRPLLPALHDKTVLELGCGTGYLTPVLAATCRSVLALDFSENAIRAARARCSSTVNASFRAGDALDTALDRKFDVITGRFFLHEIMHRDTPRLLRRLDALLAEDGFVYFQENSYFNPIARFTRKHLVGHLGIPKFGSENELPFDRIRFEMYRRCFRYCERYVDGVEVFQKINQYLVPFRSNRLAAISAGADGVLTRLQRRTGWLNNWSYTQTIYASQTVPRSAVLGPAGPPRTEGRRTG
jgi:ubiquinone/menaquinone biosynthesis C-methylase UbiE